MAVGLFHAVCITGIHEGLVCLGKFIRAYFFHNGVWLVGNNRKDQQRIFPQIKQVAFICKQPVDRSDIGNVLN